MYEIKFLKRKETKSFWKVNKRNQVYKWKGENQVCRGSSTKSSETASSVWSLPSIHFPEEISSLLILDPGKRKSCFRVLCNPFLSLRKSNRSSRHTVDYWVVKVFKCFLAREHFANWVISRKDFLFCLATLEIWEFQNQIYFNFPFKLITTATNIDQLLQNPKCFSPFIIFLLSLLKTAQGDMLPINCVPTLVEGEQPFLKVSGSEFVHL